MRFWGGIGEQQWLGYHSPSALGKGPGQGGRWHYPWPTGGGLRGSRKANWKHGYYSAESIAMRRYISWLLLESEDLIERI